MTQNTIDFLRESAKYMATDRPDLYTPESALGELSVTMDKMRDIDGPGWTTFASFMLFKHIEEFDDNEDVEEWFFMRRISSMAIFPSEGEVQVFGYTKGSGTLKHGVDLLGPDEQDLDL